MPFRLRVARPEDAAALRAIYAPYVRDTPISFELEVPTVEEMARRVRATLARYPWLVAEGPHGTLLGYAYGGTFRARPAYRYAVEVSAYVGGSGHRRGVGTALYRALLAILERQGFRQAYAGATLPNAASVGFHEAMGFQPIGVFPEAGYKFRRWHDVGWFSRPLSRVEPVVEVVPFEAMAEGEVARSIQA